ncbi:HET-domain-containing protein, partial [Periconia macrospinosa]
MLGLSSAPPVLSVKPSELTLSVRIQGIKQWIRNCDMHHSLDCAPTVDDNIFPIRLIECSSNSLRLVDIEEVRRENKRPQYITLSHCWGESRTMYKTTQRTLSEHQSLIPFDALPQTFQDAINICRELGVQYLWIDSLCIIQDNNEDWNCEASKMGSIFHGAFLTISALSSANSDGGCIFPPDIKPFTKLDLPGANRGTVYIQERRSTAIISNIFEQSPMARRGWILQEMILSNRVIHFGKGQIFWQCRKLFQSEDRLYTSIYKEAFSDIVGPFHPLPSLQNLSSKTWWAIVVEHWSRSLTFPQDSLPSLEGMKNFYQKITGDESVLGLWKKNLPVHLSW